MPLEIFNVILYKFFNKISLIINYKINNNETKFDDK